MSIKCKSVNLFWVVIELEIAEPLFQRYLGCGNGVHVVGVGDVGWRA